MTPELSVVILSYNNFTRTTGPCLFSLSGVDEPDLEIIVVDNGSDKATRDHLVRVSSRDQRIRLILNNTNRGYAGGNNDGVSQARSDMIVLLNSDTRVLARSLSLLVSRLRSTRRPVILGPVTNAAGTEQQIYTRPGNAQSILDQGDAWSRQARESYFASDQLTFFCAAMRTETYRDLGGLDESFGLGFYEDADFCRRALEKGMSIEVMEEAFIYHEGSAGFARIPEITRKLLHRNRRRFRKKHGRTATAHVRYKNLKVLNGYLVEIQRDGPGPAVQYRFENRLRRAGELCPNNPVKKIMYGARLAKVKRMAGQLGVRLPVQ